MSFNKIFEANKEAHPFFEEIYQKKLLTSRLDGQEGVISVKKDASSQLCNMLLASAEEGGVSSLTELFVASQIVGCGPKIFRPKYEECLVFEQINLNLPVTEFVQPFATFIVEFPENYYKSLEVDCPQKELANTHSPVVVVSHFDQNILSLVCYFTSKLSIVRLLWQKEEATVLEDMMNEPFIFNKSMSVTEEEWKTTNRVFRVALNCCMLLMQLGCKTIGPENQSYYDRCKRHVKINKGEKLQKAKLELKKIPFIYDFEQHIKLFSEQKEYHESEATGRIMVPHWRRGHYVNQPYGPGNSLRKKILIKPIFVNKYLNLDAKVKTIYET